MSSWQLYCHLIAVAKRHTTFLAPQVQACIQGFNMVSLYFCRSSDYFDSLSPTPTQPKTFVNQLVSILLLLLWVWASQWQVHTQATELTDKNQKIALCITGLWPYDPLDPPIHSDELS
jgi:hypothetical protein